jgi:hypothetical protein
MKRIAAAEHLTPQDHDLLGTSLKRLFSVTDDGAFADLLRELGTFEVEPGNEAKPAEPEHRC